MFPVMDYRAVCGKRWPRFDKACEGSLTKSCIKLFLMLKTAAKASCVKTTIMAVPFSLISPCIVINCILCENQLE